MNNFENFLRTNNSDVIKEYVFDGNDTDKYYFTNLYKKYGVKFDKNKCCKKCKKKKCICKKKNNI